MLRAFHYSSCTDNQDEYKMGAPLDAGRREEEKPPPVHVEIP